MVYKTKISGPFTARVSVQRIGFAILALAGLLLSVGPITTAQEQTVTNNVKFQPGSTGAETACLLADAITAANTNTATGDCPAGVGANGTTDKITLTTDISIDSLLTISTWIEIDGGASKYTITQTTDDTGIFTVPQRWGRLTLRNITLTGGEGSVGGAISADGNLTVIDSVFNDNHASATSGYAGAIYNNRDLHISGSVFSNNSGARAGAIYHNGTNTRNQVTIRGSTFNGNSAKVVSGGAIAHDESAYGMLIENSTFYDNSAKSKGGAVWVQGWSELTIRHSTFVDNEAEGAGKTVFAETQATVELYNSLIASEESGDDCSGIDTSTGNLVEDGSCSAALSGDARLGTRTGSPAYYPLQDGSQAINAANATQCNNLSPKTDQAGTARPQGAACEIGAHEAPAGYASAATDTPSLTPSPTPSVTPSLSPSLTPSLTPTATLTPTNTPTPTATLTPTDTPTPTATLTPTNTPTPTATPTPTDTLAPGAPDPPQNLHIDAMSPLAAMWDPPASGADSYTWRSRKKAEDSDWEDWATWSATGKTMVELASDNYGMYRWEVEVKSIRNSLESHSSRADWPSRATGAQRGESRAGAETLAPPIFTCESLSSADNGIHISAPYGLRSGIQCQEIDAAGIGIQSVIDAGFIKAVDIWGYVDQSVQVCFDASGPLLFLDAAMAPRAVMSIASFTLDGKTCASISRSGSIVLQSSGAGLAPVATVVATTGPAAVSASLTNCMVTTTDVLNFRDAPNGSLIRVIPQMVTLTALDRTSGWYKVDWYGLQGWISADYVTPHGTCG